MLNENIKNLRREKGLSQEELAFRLNVVRQTVSKWENGLSAPDAGMLIGISEALGASVSTLLGETVESHEAEDMNALLEKLETVNLMFAREKEARRQRLHTFLIVMCALIIAIAVILFFAKSPYLYWDYGDPELAAAGTMLHAFEFVFIRVAPFALAGLAVGIVLTRGGRR